MPKDKSTGKKLADMMYGNPEGAAFGVYPQMKGKRSKQDPEAAKNVPVDVARGFAAGALGMPGDIESLIRMLPGLDEETILPTSEDILKRIPFGTDTPAGKAASGLGILGGGFYTGPGSAARAITSVPKAVKRAGLDFAESISPVNVIKPKGGNWLGGRLPGNMDDSVQRLKPYRKAGDDGTFLQKDLERAKQRLEMLEADPYKMESMVSGQRQTIEEIKKKIALNNWVESNLGNYVKKQMGTPDDPVRALHEQGITHMGGRMDDLPAAADETLRQRRAEAGFPEEGMGQSEMARKYETLTDDAIAVDLAGDIQSSLVNKPAFDAVRAELDSHMKSLKSRFRQHLENSGLSPDEVTALDNKTPLTEKAYIIGDDRYQQLMDEFKSLSKAYSNPDIETAKQNPFISKLPPETKLYSGYASDAGFDHVIDVLKQDVANGLIRPDQLNKVSMEQAVRRTYEYDQEMAKKMAEANAKTMEAFPVHKEYPEGYKWYELKKPENLPEGYSLDDMGNVVDDKGHLTNHPGEKMLEEALKNEGEMMGHCVGGYCPDVLEGKSRIFTLRGPKGESHVTIETSPQADYNEAKRLLGIDDPTSGDMARLIAEGKLPATERIVQIKGKQNAAPVEKYLPYVQDFVKGGEWSDIGDFRNTGLIREGDQIMTPAEHSDWLLQQLQPPTEGMAHGGRVRFSDNPDTMALELAGGGAVAKLLKMARAPAKSKQEIEALAERMAPQVTGEYVRESAKSAKTVAGKTQKQFQREKNLPVDVRATAEERVPQPVDIEKLKGNVMIGIPGDPTLAGKSLYSVGDVKLGSPSPQHGGPLYGLYNDENFWASGLGAARRVQNLAKEAGEQYDAPVMGKYIMMGPESINYAQHFADANLQAIDLSKMTKKQVEQFNELIRKGSPKSGPRESFPGIEDKGEAYLQMAIDPELRKHFNALMQMPTVTENLNLPSGIDIRFAITEPALRDLETGVTGFSMGRMRPEVSSKELPLSMHPTYSHDIPGEFSGQSKYPMPYELSFPDTLKTIRENPAQAPQEFGSLKMVGPRQTIDQQMIDEIKAYEERMKQLTGKKKGGEVKAPAAKIDGNKFVLAAQKYGLDDNIDALNMMVSLVNQGATVDEAARVLASSLPQVEQEVQGSMPVQKKSEQRVQNPVHFTESPDAMRLALTKRN